MLPSVRAKEEEAKMRKLQPRRPKKMSSPSISRKTRMKMRMYSCEYW